MTKEERPRALSAQAEALQSRVTVLGGGGGGGGAPSTKPEIQPFDLSQASATTTTTTAPKADAQIGAVTASVPFPNTPPRYPLLRLHGVLAPRHPWRARVVPRPPQSHAECTKSSSTKKSTTAATKAGAEPGAAVVSRIEQPEPFAQRGAGEAALVPTAEVVLTSTLLATGAAQRVRRPHDRARGRYQTSRPLPACSARSVARAIRPSPPDLARTRATRRAVAAPWLTRAKPRPFLQRQENFGPPSPARTPRAAALPAMGRYLGLLSRAAGISRSKACRRTGPTRPVPAGRHLPPRVAEGALAEGALARDVVPPRRQRHDRSEALERRPLVRVQREQHRRCRGQELTGPEPTRCSPLTAEGMGSGRSPCRPSGIPYTSPSPDPRWGSLLAQCRRLRTSTNPCRRRSSPGSSRTRPSP